MTVTSKLHAHEESSAAVSKARCVPIGSPEMQTETMVCMAVLKRPRCHTQGGSESEVTVTSKLYAQVVYTVLATVQSRKRGPKGQAYMYDRERNSHCAVVVDSELPVCLLRNEKKQKARPKGVNLKVR